MSKKNYGDDSITILEGLEPVRKRPGMYCGSTDSRGLHYLAWEIVDNAVDEALNGYGKEIQITIQKDGGLKVRDFGRGVPCGKHPSGCNTLEVVYGKLHAGGKFDEEAYKSAGGLHGVGGAVVNALSTKMQVTSFREGKATTIIFEDGGSKHSDIVVKKSKERGTEVIFYPDPSIMTDTKFNFDTICARVKEKAYFVKIKFAVKDERTGKEEIYEFSDGIKSYLEDMSSETKIFPIFMAEGGDDITVQAGFMITASYTEKIESFANMVHTTQGGPHETGFRQAITRAFNDYGKQVGILKKPLEGADIREGLVGVVSVNIPEHLLQFESQTKEKLGTTLAKNAVENVVYNKLKYYLIENPKTAKNALDKMVKASQTREAVRKAKEEMRSVKKKSKIEQLVSSKLSPCRDKNGKNNELFLVEGDSAAGSAKQGRDSKFQAILPLRGEVLATTHLTSNQTGLKQANGECLTLHQNVKIGLGEENPVIVLSYIQNSKNMPKESGIYKITNLINGKVYIGQSTNIYKRLNSYHNCEYKNVNNACYNSKFYTALRKYGLKNFKVEVLELCDKTLLNEKEIFYIEKYNSFLKGYNSTSGGDNIPIELIMQKEKCRENIKKINSIQKGENHPRSKLTNDDVKNMRIMYKNNNSVYSIFEFYKNKNIHCTL